MSETSGKRWFAVDILVDANAVEAIEFALNELDSLGIEVDSFRKKDNEPRQVSGFFNELPDAAAIRDAVEMSLHIHQLSESSVRNIATRTIEQADWLAEWKKHWRPTEIGKFTIAPPWEALDKSEQIVIRIEPNMAFGTGTHDTTKLCLAAIGRLYEPPQTVLDVGTGTGILAIAAAKLGAEEVFACDTDSDSVTIARENALLNETGWIEFAEGSIEADGREYDFVIANLTVDVIVAMLDLLVEKTRSVLLLSGILSEQQNIIVSALEKFQFKKVEIDRSGEWISVVATK